MGTSTQAEDCNRRLNEITGLDLSLDGGLVIAMMQGTMPGMRRGRCGR